MQATPAGSAERLTCDEATGRSGRCSSGGMLCRMASRSGRGARSARLVTVVACFSLVGCETGQRSDFDGSRDDLQLSASEYSRMAASLSEIGISTSPGSVYDALGVEGAEAQGMSACIALGSAASVEDAVQSYTRDVEPVAPGDPRVREIVAVGLTAVDYMCVGWAVALLSS